MVARAPTNWELVAAIKNILDNDAGLTAWFLTTTGQALRVVEYHAAMTPVRLQVGIEISSVLREPPVSSCPKFVVVLDPHVYETGSNTAIAHEALGRIEASLDDQDTFVDAKNTEWGRVALRNIKFRGRLGQSPSGDGWTVASTFTALTYYF